MVSIGCLSYLDYVRNTRANIPFLDFIHMVCEFIDLFPTDLTGIMLKRDIDFVISVESSIQPISISPYYMALVELKKVNIQYQDPLVKGFITPSVSQVQFGKQTDIYVYVY